MLRPSICTPHPHNDPKILQNQSVIPETEIQLTITLSDPELNDEQLQEAVENLRQELQAVEGVQEADLIPIAQGPTIPSIPLGNEKFCWICRFEIQTFSRGKVLQ